MTQDKQGLEVLRQITIYQLKLILERAIDKKFEYTFEYIDAPSETKTFQFSLAEQVEGSLNLLKYLEDQIAATPE